MRGEFRPDDIRQIFQDLRGKHKVGERFNEIGHFIAHREIRDHGAVQGAAANLASFHRLWRAARFNPSWVPTVDQAKAHALRNYNVTRDLFKHLPIPPSLLNDGKRLETALLKLDLRGGRLCLIDGTDGEYMVFEKYMQHRENRPYINDRLLFNEFCGALCSHARLDPNDISKLQYLSPLISLYAISKMHNSQVKIGKSTAILRAGFEPEWNGIVVHAVHKIDNNLRSSREIALVFGTTLDPRRYCYPEMCAYPFPQCIGWVTVLVLDEDGRLRYDYDDYDDLEVKRLNVY